MFNSVFSWHTYAHAQMHAQSNTHTHIQTCASLKFLITVSQLNIQSFIPISLSYESDVAYAACGVSLDHLVIGAVEEDEGLQEQVKDHRLKAETRLTNHK